jgi:hypothetical protein
VYIVGIIGFKKIERSASHFFTMKFSLVALATLAGVAVADLDPIVIKVMTMGSKSATATPARVASATKENFMVKKWLADLILKVLSL